MKSTFGTGVMFSAARSVPLKNRVSSSVAVMLGNAAAGSSLT